MEDKFEWRKIIRINFIILKIVGLWPSGNKACELNFYTIFSITSILFFQTGHILLQTINLFYINDLHIITGTIFVSLMQTMAVIKGYLLTKNIKILKHLMTTLNIDIFQPKNSHQRQMVQPNINNWKFIVVSFWFFAAGWLFFTSSFPLLDRTFREYRLPCFAWFPYNTKTSPQYELSYIYQVIAITHLCMTNVNVDTLIAALNMYIGAQLDILGDDLRRFTDSVEDGEANEKLKKCIYHHKEILKFSDAANQFYNWLLFVVFLVGGISIGITMFLLTVVVPFSNEFYAFLSYVICIVIQVFLYCWFGNEIEVKSNKLPYAIFEADWTHLSPEVKRNTVIFTIRLQRTLEISALGLFNLSLETFVKIMKTSYSYFALLRRVNSVE